MRASFVVPPHPVSNDTSGFLKRLERVLPDTFFLETAKEPFDDPILFWGGVRGNKLLLEPIVSTGLPKPTDLEDQPLVTPQDRGLNRSQCLCEVIGVTSCFLYRNQYG